MCLFKEGEIVKVSSMLPDLRYRVVSDEGLVSILVRGPIQTEEYEPDTFSLPRNEVERDYFLNHVREAEEAILVAEEAQLWEGERQFYFTWDPIRYYQHLDTYEVIAREAKELERPLFRLFEESREQVNPNPEEILMEVM